MKNRVFQMQPQDALARNIIGMAMKVHATLGCGFVETVYRNALIFEMNKSGLKFVKHPQLSVFYEGLEVGTFQADLIIENRLIIELKTVDALQPAHSAQIVNYLKATQIDLGLLLNFGTSKLEFKTKSRLYPPADLY